MIKKYADEIRYYIIDMILNLGFGHLGGSLSIADILAVLYGEEMKLDPKNPHFKDRDYFVLSKGHGGPSLYAALAIKGFFSREVLYTLNKAPTTIPSHPDKKLIPGVEATTGSLGQGISQAVGIALGICLKKTTQRVYCIVGDGELQEGQCWEAIQHAAHTKLSNLIVFIDFNKMQLDGSISDICDTFDLRKKMDAFGWNALEIDGHNIEEIQDSLANARQCLDKPTAIIANTIKGKGVSELEKECPHHIRVDQSNRDFLEKAKKNLGRR